MNLKELVQRLDGCTTVYAAGYARALRDQGKIGDQTWAAFIRDFCEGTHVRFVEEDWPRMMELDENGKGE